MLRHSLNLAAMLMQLAPGVVYAKPLKIHLKAELQFTLQTKQNNMHGFFLKQRKSPTFFQSHFWQRQQA